MALKSIDQIFEEHKTNKIYLNALIVTDTK